MRKYFRNIFSLILALIMVSSTCSNALAGNLLKAEEPGEHRVTFSLSRLEEEGRLQYTVIEPDGSEATVGIEKIQTLARAAGQTWRVWYTWLTNSVEFYMTVSDNKVTSVYDEMISITGGSYSNVKLTKTTAYGKLSFTASAIGGLVSRDCWLKGTVTGENDEIDVTWSM